MDKSDDTKCCQGCGKCESEALLIKDQAVVTPLKNNLALSSKDEYM